MRNIVEWKMEIVMNIISYYITHILFLKKINKLKLKIKISTI